MPHLHVKELSNDPQNHQSDSNVRLQDQAIAIAAEIKNHNILDSSTDRKIDHNHQTDSTASKIKTIQTAEIISSSHKSANKAHKPAKSLDVKPSGHSKATYGKSIIQTAAIEEIVNSSSSDKIPIRDVIDAMDSVGFGLILMIFAIGIIIPTPPPFPSIISIPLVVFSFQMAMGYSSPKLPKKFFDVSLKRSVLAMLIQKSSLIIRKIERFLKPRFSFMNKSTSERVVGWFILLFSSFILMPLPLSNYIPGIGILVISFGLLAKDGLVTMIGIGIGIIGITISITAVIFGIEILKYVSSLFH